MFDIYGISSPSGCIPQIPEIEQIINQLERGTLVTKFSWKKGPERKILAIRLDTRQITWTRSTAAITETYEGAVNWTEIKEIRLGKMSQTFEKWSEDASEFENSQCFVVFYGTEFNLRMLSIAVSSEIDCDRWIRALKHLSKNKPYILQVQAWLRKQFHAIANQYKKITLKDIKFFFSKISSKISANKLRDAFNDLDTKKTGEIGFDDFTVLYEIITHEDNPAELFDNILLYSSDIKTLTLQEFGSFLSTEQNYVLGNDDRAVSQIICDFLKHDPLKEIEEPSFTIPEFLDFLFSRENEIWDPTKDKVYQDMSRPLSHYWISSSHNTYLTGNQVNSMSSLECYARCLRMGCRCIELDCWDGPEGMPCIFHGRTLTTKIKFVDVIKTIRDHAFATSEYPVILSIEQRCSLPQQRKMALAMLDVFGEMLMVPAAEGLTELPSPYNLRHKIILKHKKLSEGQEDSSIISKNDLSDTDIVRPEQNGIMYVENPENKEWEPHFFLLTQNKLFYTKDYEPFQGADISEDEDDNYLCGKCCYDLPNEELHLNETWFHGYLKGGGRKAEELIRAYSHLGDGTFLVRQSSSIEGYSLSFWYDGQVKHCHIRSKSANQQRLYYFNESKYFDSLYSLIVHYRTSPLITQNYSIVLGEPVPQLNLLEDNEWYKNVNKTQAEEILNRIQSEGVFLIRTSENESNCYTISFRTDKRIKHLRIKQEGAMYTVGNTEFDSLEDLISFYKEHPIYDKFKLTHAVNEEINRKGSIASTGSTEQRSSSISTCQMDLSTKLDEYLNESIFQGCLELIGAAVDKKRNPESPDMKWIIRILPSSSCKTFTCAVKSEDLGPNVENKKMRVKVSVHVSLTSALYEQSEENLFANLSFIVLQERITVECQRITADMLQNVREEIENRFYYCMDVNGGHFEQFVRSSKHPLLIAFSFNKAQEWYSSIEHVIGKAHQLKSEHRELERMQNVAKEISDLIIYFRTVNFDLEKLRQQGFIFYQMSSFPELKAEKIICQQDREFFLKYHQVQFSRVYPNWQRFYSSNYNPMNLWNCGSQMVALNFQTGDKPMQLNQAKFRDNGKCGYLLKPEFMFREGFDPFERSTLIDVEPYIIYVRVIAGRHLYKCKKKVASPCVEVEIIGAPFDSAVKRTARVLDNGLNPKWNETFVFEVANPHLALLRFFVQDLSSDFTFIGQATYPVTCLRTGYRSVWLQNAYSEDLELSSLLVHINIATKSDG